MTARPRTIFHAVVFAVGAGVLAFLLARMGTAGLARVFGAVGVAFAGAAACDLASIACDAFAIRAFLAPRLPAGARVPYGRAIVAQASGVAINRLTPANSLGEATKVTLLMAHAPRDAAVSAIVMFNITTIFVGVTAIVIGVPITLLLLDLPPEVRLATYVGTGVLLAFAGAIALLVRRGPLATLIGVARRARVISAARATRWREGVRAIDADVRTITTPGSGLARGVVGVIGSRACNWGGTLVLLHAADLPLSPAIVVATLSVGILVTWMSNLIPLGVGLADTYNYALYGALGAGGAAGLDYTMINRARTLLLATTGLAIMGLGALAARYAGGKSTNRAGT